MKHRSGKSGYKLHPAQVKTAKPTCGTLSYMSECRGVAQKGGSLRLAPSDGIDKLVRK
jgi:hypothetical protein